MLVDDTITLGDLVKVMREYAEKFEVLEVSGTSFLFICGPREDLPRSGAVVGDTRTFFSERVIGKTRALIDLL